MTKLYMAVTSDDLELPVYVTDDYKELAEAYGINKFTLLSSISKGLNGRYNGVKFVKVIIDDEDEE